MRGEDVSQPKLFVTTTRAEETSMRSLRKLLDAALEELDEYFDAMYLDIGRESVAPERVIRASMLQVLFTIRSEHRKLVKQIRYNMRYRVSVCTRGFRQRRHAFRV